VDDPRCCADAVSRAQVRAFVGRIFQRVDAPIALLQPGGGLVYANPALRALTARLGRPDPAPGARLSEVLGSTAADEALRTCVARRDEEPAGALRCAGPGGVALLAATVLPLCGARGPVRLAALVGREIVAPGQRGEDGASPGQLDAIAQIAAGAAHEIRNPLTAISGFLQLLEATVPEGAASKYLQIVREEIGRLARIAEDLLLLSRSSRVQRTACDLGAVLDAVAELSRGRAAAFGVELALRVQPELPPVSADPERLEQVLLNLVGNALEAMAGPGRLRLRAYAADGCGEVRITDTGPGIPPDILARVFEPFFTTKAGGTGLGLAVSQSIVRSFGGQIVACSPPGEGASFTVRLPFAAPAPAAPLVPGGAGRRP